MEGNEKTTTEQEAEDLAQDDAFLSGWDGEQPTEDGEDQSRTEEGDEPPAEESDTKEDKGGEAGGRENDGDQTVEEQPPKEQTWEVNHLGRRKTMRAEDITPELLQKGMDYDRVREQYDNSKPIMSMVSELARQSGLSVEDYVRMVRTEAKKSEGLDEDAAKRAVELEDREAAVSAKEAEDARTEAARKDSEAAIQRNLEEFSKAFPEVYAKARTDASAIPDSVWADVSEGLSLTAAYAKYAVAEAAKAVQTAEHKAQAEEQNQKNTQRTTGSLSSAGSDAKSKDPFLEGWGD